MHNPIPMLVNRLTHRLRPGAVLLLALVVTCHGAPTTNLPLTSADFLTTDAYQREAVRVLLNEANRVATALKLEEKLPITEADLVEEFIVPPGLSRKAKNGVGNVITTNYGYFVSVGNKFSFLMTYGMLNRYNALKAQYRQPLGQDDTNIAYQIATQALAALSMDVQGLNRDCRLSITPWEPGGGYSVPLYWVSWTRKDNRPHPWIQAPPGELWKPVADVQILLPTRTIMELRVEEAKYILRDSLEVTNAEVPQPQANDSTESGGDGTHARSISTNGGASRAMAVIQPITAGNVCLLVWIAVPLYCAVRLRWKGFVVGMLLLWFFFCLVVEAEWLPYPDESRPMRDAGLFAAGFAHFAGLWFAVYAVGRVAAVRSPRWRWGRRVALGLLISICVPFVLGAGDFCLMDLHKAPAFSAPYGTLMDGETPAYAGVGYCLFRDESRGGPEIRFRALPFWFGHTTQYFGARWT